MDHKFLAYPYNVTEFFLQAPAQEFADFSGGWVYGVDKRKWGKLHKHDTEEVRMMSKKYFVFDSYRSVYNWLKVSEPRDRNIYEMLRVEDVRGGWCHFYVDIDFEYAKHGYKYTREQLEDAFARQVPAIEKALVLEKIADTVDSVVLDSSSDSKFSRHVVFHTFKDGDPVMFKTNFEDCKNFYHHILSTYCITKIDKATLDVTVYSKNRLFRTFGSTKLSIDPSNPVYRPLKLYDMATGTPIFFDDSSYETFLTTLITYFDKTPKVITFEDRDFKKLETEGRTRNPGGKRRVKASTSVPKYLHEIAKMIQDDLRNDGQHGVEIVASHVLDDTVAVFNSNQRKCALAKREHSRNNVYYVVKLGEAKLSWRQKCHSMACKNPDSTAPRLLPQRANELAWEHWIEYSALADEILAAAGAT